MKKLLFISTIFLLISIFLLYILASNTSVSVSQVEGFEEEEALLLKKFPPEKNLTLEELNQLKFEHNELIEKKIEKLKKSMNQ